MSGTEMQRAKESAADIMRQKQAAGTTSFPFLAPYCHRSIYPQFWETADSDIVI
jgi:hypothetical protein